MYLGLPFLPKKPSLLYWNSVIEKFQKKLAGWKAKLLSFGVKIFLLKACLQSILLYLMSFFFMLAKVVDSLQKIQKNFMWSRVEEKRKMALVNSNQVCKSKKNGGLGIRNFKSLNKALVSKLGWATLEGDKDWSKILRTKYLSYGLFCLYLGKNSSNGSSVLWKNILKTKGLIRKESRMQIGNSRRSLFWGEIWKDEVPIKEVVNNQGLMDRLRVNVGEKVENYLE